MKYLLIAFLAFSGGILLNPNFTPYERIVSVPVFMPVKQTHYSGEQIDRIAAVVPASALK